MVGSLTRSTRFIVNLCTQACSIQPYISRIGILITAYKICNSGVPSKVPASSAVSSLSSRNLVYRGEWQKQESIGCQFEHTLDRTRATRLSVIGGGLVMFHWVGVTRGSSGPVPFRSLGFVFRSKNGMDPRWNGKLRRAKTRA